jgi:Na+/citrate or Na+/malate symporter
MVVFHTIVSYTFSLFPYLLNSFLSLPHSLYYLILIPIPLTIVKLQVYPIRNQCSFFYNLIE